jgi:ribonuclease J
MSGTRFMPLCGSNMIGGSKLLLEFDESRVLLDFGTNFKGMNEYYEEFLKPRAPCGILDHVTMGILPNVRGLYREDLEHPDVVLDGLKIGRIDALLLSHAHVDHSGDIGFLRRDVPVVTSRMSAAIAKAMQDSSQTAIGSDGVYANLREHKPGSPVLDAVTGDMPQRDFCLADGKPSKGLEEFWKFYPPALMSKATKKRIVPGKLLTGIPDVKFTACPVDHSIKGACGYIIETSRGSIVYTGDLRLHGLEGKKTLEFADAARRAKPLALITEGTTVGRPAGEQVSEEAVQENISGLLDGMKGEFAIADFGPRNIERLQIFLRAAKEAGRRLVVPVKDAYLLSAMRLADGSTPVPGDDMLIYDCPRSDHGGWEKYTFGHLFPGSSIKPSAVRAAPGDFLLAFSFWDMKHMVDLKPEKGHYLYSSSEAHSEEQEIDFMRLRHWLDRFGIKHYGFDFDEKDRPFFPKGLHASGHASEEDLREIVNKIDPEAVIPVHTEEPGWFEKEFGGSRRVLLPEQCEWVDL